MNQKYIVSDKSFFTNTGSEYKIIGLSSGKALIKFTKTGAVKTIDPGNIPAGKVKDLYEPSRYGVGYLGEYPRNAYHKEAHQLWSNMIKRCYSDDPKGYKAKGTTVDARWQCFARFLYDLPDLDGFEFWLKKQNYQLDKDLKFPEANVYSFETCQFVPEAVNKSAGKANKKLVSGEWVTTIS